MRTSAFVENGEKAPSYSPTETTRNKTKLNEAMVFKILDHQTTKDTDFWQMRHKWKESGVAPVHIQGEIEPRWSIANSLTEIKLRVWEDKGSYSSLYRVPERKDLHRDLQSALSPELNTDQYMHVGELPESRMGGKITQKDWTYQHPVKTLG